MDEAIIVGVLNGRGEATDLLNGLAPGELLNVDIDDLTWDVLHAAGWRRVSSNGADGFN